MAVRAHFDPTASLPEALRGVPSLLPGRASWVRVAVAVAVVGLSTALAHGVASAQCVIDADCNDTVPCTDDSCDTGTGECANTANDSLCDDGQFCTGAETCDVVNGCQAGTAPDCDDGVTCTDESCDELGDGCLNVPNDGLCDDGQFCTGTETCDVVNGCQAGTAPDCDDEVTCTDDSCDELDDECLNIPNDGLCGDDEFCNGAETCDAVNGCQVGTAPNCDDGVACTDDSCDELDDECLNIPNDGLCDDANECTDDACDPGADCQHAANTAPCDDGNECTADDTCSAESCVGTALDEGTGCDDGNPCTIDDACDVDSECFGTLLDEGAGCDDSNPCTIDDECDANSECFGTALDEGTGCDDGNPCTIDDACDVDSECFGALLPDGGECDDGVFCNGADTCSSGICSDHAGDPCPGTECNTCQEDTDSCFDPIDTTCTTDDLFCTGAETCDGEGACVSGSDPCPGADGDGDCAESCNEDGDDCLGADPAGAVCADDGNACTTDECDAMGGCAHPAGNAGAECRAAAGVCDAAETCDGMDDACPVDAKSTAECRAAAGACDVAEACDGVDDACPADAKSTAECRAAAGVCDVAEACDGVSDDCPSDGFEAADTVCRAAADECDLAETCSGAGADCPAKAGRPVADEDGPCDLVDVCPDDADADQTDTDDDGMGDVCDPCTNGSGAQADGARLMLKKIDDTPGDDSFKLMGSTIVPTDPPLAPEVNGMRVVLAGDTEAFFDVTIPGGDGWEVNRGRTRWIYRAPAGSSGVVKALLKNPHERPDILEFKIIGKRGTFAPPPDASELVGTIVVDQATEEPTGQCGEAPFPSDDCKENSSGRKLLCS